jgi:predicted PurR-regulated permease PerM
MGALGILVSLLALVPLAGYVLAVALPVLAVRMRGRQAARFAGLRTLAK